MTCFPKALFFSEWRRGGVDGWEDQEEDALIYIFMYIYLVPTYDDPAGFLAVQTIKNLPAMQKMQV